MFVCLLFCFFFVVFGGFKGQVRWPEPDLALNTFFVCHFFSFVFVC